MLQNHHSKLVETPRKNSAVYYWEINNLFNEIVRNNSRKTKQIVTLHKVWEVFEELGTITDQCIALYLASSQRASVIGQILNVGRYLGYSVIDRLGMLRACNSQPTSERDAIRDSLSSLERQPGNTDEHAYSDQEKNSPSSVIPEEAEQLISKAKLNYGSLDENF